MGVSGVCGCVGSCNSCVCARLCVMYVRVCTQTQLTMRLVSEFPVHTDAHSSFPVLPM